MKFKKLLLSITLLASFAGVRAMENTDTATDLGILFQQININPIINVNSQTLLTAQTIKGIWASCIGQALIQLNIVTPDNTLIQNFYNALQNAKQNVTPFSNEMGNQVLLFALETMNDGNQLTDEQTTQIIQKQQSLQQNQTVMQAFQSMNTVSSDETVQNAMNALIDNLPMLINQNQNNQNNQIQIEE